MCERCSVLRPVSVTPNTPPDTLSDVATATTPDYPVSVGWWIYYDMDYHFNVSFYCLYSNIQCDCGVLSNNILHNILNVRIQTIKTNLGNIIS